jgi:hypothetical protein
MAGNVEPSNSDPKEEPQCRHRGVDGAWRDTTRDQVKLVAANILEGRFVRRAPEEDREILDEANVGVLGRRLELADCHVFDHAPAQRAYGRVGHRVLLSDLRWFEHPHLQTGRPYSRTPQRTQPRNRSPE